VQDAQCKKESERAANLLKIMEEQKQQIVQFKKMLSKDLPKILEDEAKKGETSYTLTEYDQQHLYREILEKYAKRHGLTLTCNSWWRERDSGDKDSGEGACAAGYVHDFILSW
jgi:hypothetical protein